jgi:hypothetical protein
VVEAVDVVGEPSPLADLAEQARRHPAAEDGREQLDRVAVGMVERQSVDADRDVRLLRLLRVDAHPAVGVWGRGLRFAGVGVDEIAEQLLRLLEQSVADAAGDAEHHA